MKRLFSVIAMTFAMLSPACSQGTRSLSISEMFDLMETNNSTLKAGRTGIEAAHEGVAAAKSQRLPDISTQLSGSYIGNVFLTDRDFGNAHGMSSPHWGNQLIVDARQTVYAGGAINAGIKLAESGERQSVLSTELNREQLRFIALGQYLDLEKLANREQVLVSNIELTKQLVSNIKDKYEQGVALKNDITRYELQLETLKLRLTELCNSRKILNHQLCNSLGLPSDVMIEPTDDARKEISRLKQEGEAQWQQLASVNSPELEMASVNTDMARQQEKIARSELLPKVQVVAQNNFNGPITFELPPIDKNLNVWYVGVGVQYSLSSLFKSNRRLRQAKYATRQAQEQHAVVAEQLNNRMQEAYTNYLQSYTELETRQKNVELARQNYQVVNDRYLNQLALVTDMIDASNMRLDAEITEADARINIAYAYYKMKYIAGNL